MSLLDQALDNFLQTSPVPVHEFAFLSPADIPFKAEVRKACEDNLCGRYGKSWTCPPGAGPWEELRDYYQSFPRALVFTTLHKLEDSFDFEGMNQASIEHAEAEEYLLTKVSAQAEGLQAKSLPAGGLEKGGLPASGRTALLGAGSCSICPECTYPDAPCRLPERARRSMEACGIDVVTLSKNTGIRYFNGPDTVTYFSVFLFG